jgi:hypothetical protein
MHSATPQSVRISDKETLEWSSRETGALLKSTQDLETLAHWLDTIFEIPGIGVKFGIDAILGLLPGVGDTASALASVYILQAASKHGVPPDNTGADDAQYRNRFSTRRYSHRR